MKPKNPRLAVLGPPTLTDERVLEVIVASIIKHSPKQLITAGGPAGVCERTRAAAELRAVPLTLHFLDYSAPDARAARAKAILRDCDSVLIIHDGLNLETLGQMTMAERLGLPIDFHLLEPVARESATPAARFPLFQPAKL